MFNNRLTLSPQILKVSENIYFEFFSVYLFLICIAISLGGSSNDNILFITIQKMYKEITILFLI